MPAVCCNIDIGSYVLNMIVSDQCCVEKRNRINELAKSTKERNDGGKKDGENKSKDKDKDKDKGKGKNKGGTEEEKGKAKENEKEKKKESKNDEERISSSEDSSQEAEKSPARVHDQPCSVHKTHKMCLSESSESDKKCQWRCALGFHDL